MAAIPGTRDFAVAARRPGVFYASLDSETALAETLWHKRRFFDASPETPLPSKSMEYTGFGVEIATPLALDLTSAPMSDLRAEWTDPEDYTACLALADDARSAGIEAILYDIRPPSRGDRPTSPRADLRQLCADRARRTGKLVDLPAAPAGAQALREHPRLNIEFKIGETGLLS